jgi:hypothetical protein
MANARAREYLRHGTAGHETLTRNAVGQGSIFPVSVRSLIGAHGPAGAAGGRRGV